MSVAIFSHTQRCSATAETESGESAVNSLLSAPDGECRVKSRVTLLKCDPSADVGMKQGGREGDKETTNVKEEGKKEGRRTEQEE